MKRTPGRLLAAASIGALLAAAPGCDDGPPPAPPAKPPPAWDTARTREAEALSSQLAALPPADAGSLSVHLAFGPDADLDLYVTGPREETVYYANTPSAIGGALVADRRCAHAAPRVETVRFPAPLMPGRYRVGVDYPHRCGEAPSAVPFALRVDEPGAGRALEGLAAHRVFEPVVLEFEVGRTGAAESRRGRVDR
jgi:hypothetical protein